MELKHLRAFVTLAEELHFGRAAQRLAIVQPALSMQIKALEGWLGVRLLDRNRHSVMLTDVGRLFLEEARATLHQAQHSADVARGLGRGETGRIRLGFVSSVLPELLPTLIRQAHQRYPGIQLELKDMPGPDQIQALKSGQLDFGLMRLPAPYAGVQTQAVLHESIIVALPAGHPLAKSPIIDAKALAHLPVLILARRYAAGFYDSLLQAIAAQGGKLAVADELGEFTTMLALVAAGLGIGLLPLNAARALPPGVIARPLDLADYRTTTGLAWTSLDTAVKTTVFNLMRELFFNNGPL
jgi:DNA-binding transcriptional LysR family regulator